MKTPAGLASRIAFALSLMAGVLAVNNTALGDKLYFMINASGVGLAPFDSWLLLRGIKTLKVRMDQQQSNAQRIAEFLENHGFASIACDQAMAG